MSVLKRLLLYSIVIYLEKSVKKKNYRKKLLYVVSGILNLQKKGDILINISRNFKKREGKE